MRFQVAVLAGVLLACFASGSCLDAYHDTKDRSDPGQYSRHQGLRRVNLAYLVKFQECETLSPGSGKGFFLIASSYPIDGPDCAEGHALWRSCDQSQRYVEKNAVDACVIAILASPCQTPDGAATGAYAAAYGCAAAFDQMPIF